MTGQDYLTIPAVRLGKPIRLKWAILTNGQPVSLEGRNLILQLRHTLGTIQLPFSREGNVLTATWPGICQRWLGEYSLTLWQDKGLVTQTVVDSCRAFKLVACSEEESPDADGNDLHVISPMPLSTGTVTELPDPSEPVVPDNPGSGDNPGGGENPGGNPGGENPGGGDDLASKEDIDGVFDDIFG